MEAQTAPDPPPPPTVGSMASPRDLVLRKPFDPSFCSAKPSHYHSAHFADPPPPALRNTVLSRHNDPALPSFSGLLWCRTCRHNNASPLFVGRQGKDRESGAVLHWAVVVLLSLCVCRGGGPVISVCCVCVLPLPRDGPCHWDRAGQRGSMCRSYGWGVWRAAGALLCSGQATSLDPSLRQFFWPNPAGT